MMIDCITYWRCPKCKGTGRVIIGPGLGAIDCLACDRTGNALVDGESLAYQRMLDEIDQRQSD